jgi:putative membrane protein
MKQSLLIAIAASAVALCGVALAQNTLSPADLKFVHEAAAGSAAEVEMGNTAATKATDPKVKAFGERMVADHTKLGDELKALATQKGVTLSAGPDAKSKKTSDKISKMSGAAFDKAYMRDMVTDHQKDVAEFRKQANDATDPDIKKWASTTLPTLEEHLRLAQEALNGLGGTTN